MNAIEALNKAARLVENEAILFEEEAAEIRRILDDENENNKVEWRARDQILGRAGSLRDLARKIRLIT